MFNPQYRLSLKAKSRVICRLEAPKDVVINVRLMQGGERVCSVAEAVEVITSGDYHRGFRYFESPKLPVGNFTLAVSTYEPGVCSAFVLHVESDAAFDLTPIPQEGDGHFRSVISGTWDTSTGTGAGCANYGNYPANPRIALTIPDSLTRVRFRIQVDPVAGGNLPSVNAALFASEDGSLSRTATPATALLTTNKGVYSNPPAGTLSKWMDVQPGKYIIVPSTFKPRNAKYRLYLYTSKAIPKPTLLN
jgi:calpain-7